MAAAPAVGLARRASNAVVAVKDVVMPGHQVGLDVLGLDIEEEESSSTPRSRRRDSMFAEDDLFEVDVEDEMGNLSPAVRCAHALNRHMAAAHAARTPPKAACCHVAALISRAVPCSLRVVNPVFVRRTHTHARKRTLL